MNPPHFGYVLPVLLLEFLALSITRAVIPTLLLQTFSHNIYFVMGCAECIRGLLAFISCPAFNKLSDVLGRKACLFVTVLGTCSPVCSLAIMNMYMNMNMNINLSDYNTINMNGSSNGNFTTIPITEIETDQETIMQMQKQKQIMQEHHKVYTFVFLLALSGVFSSTFTLTFAYISDTVRNKSDRVKAYGLALATFGLSYTIGPMLGGYLANAHVYHADGANANANADGGGGGGGADGDMNMNIYTTNNHDQNQHHDHYLHPIGQQRVFCTSLVLTILDLLYIYFILPESIPHSATSNKYRDASPLSSPSRNKRHQNQNQSFDDVDYNDLYNDNDNDNDMISVITTDTRTSTSISEQWNQIKEIVPNVWSPLDTLRIFSGDPFLYEVGYIAFFYYTSLWAVVSTLTLYAAKRFHMGPARLGELMSALGFSTMLSEAVLVRIVVPAIGEKRAMRIGLAAFAMQCVVLGFANRGWQLFVCVLFSMVANLVYPSLTSLVSSAVAPEMVGEALGAVNGIKALTEGVGPLVFGTLMTFSEHSVLPGWPYFLAALFAVAAYRRSARLPDEDDEDYLSERYLRSTNSDENCGRDSLQNKEQGDFFSRLVRKIIPPPTRAGKSGGGDSALSEIELKRSFGEYAGLLSEVEGVDEMDFIRTNQQITSASDLDGKDRDEVED